ncbi:MAG: DUF1440 domain-containing protein [Actinomycetota bacterium]|nr:DUF1440 domain-containing protein [Actinomycetota bacterium]
MDTLRSPAITLSLNLRRVIWPLRSFVAGAAGTAGLTLAYAIERRMRPATKGPLDYDDSLVPGQIVLSILHLHHVTDHETDEVGLGLRWGYGSAFGLWHGELRRGVGEPWATGAFGATLMSATLTLFPLLGRTPPPWRWPRGYLLTSLATHSVYATVVGLTDRGVKAW